MSAAHPQTIVLLNNVLRHKLTAINQYFLHARMLKHQGNVRLADYEFKASLDAMKHSDMLVEHIFTLGGLPNLQELEKLLIGNTESDILKADAVLATNGIKQIKEAIVFCEQQKHTPTVELLGRIVQNQQEHLAFIQTTMDSCKTVTEQRKECA